MDEARKRLALWALIARTSRDGLRTFRAMYHLTALEQQIGMSVVHPEMDEANRWAEEKFGDKARAHAEWWVF
jgi:hypothetical protein